MHDRTRQPQSLRRRVLRGVAAVALAATTVTPLSSASALAVTPRTVTITHVHGVAHNSGGGPMAHCIVFADLHATLTSVPVKSLAHAMTGSSGGFVLVIHHAPGLSIYAGNHDGRLNIDLLFVSLDGKRMYSSRATFPYGADPTPVGVHTLVLTSHWIGHTDKSGRLEPDQYPPTLGGSVVSNPQIQWFEARGNMSVDHMLTNEWTGSIQVGAGQTFGSWGISGSITASTTLRTSQSGTLSGPAQHAVFFTNGLKTVNNEKCAATLIWTGQHDYVRPGPIMCDYTTVASWLRPPAVYRPHPATFVPCGSAPHHTWFTIPAGGIHTFRKATGHALESRVYMSAFGAWVTVSVGYSHGSVQQYHFGLNPDGNKYNCLGGNDDQWQFASRVYAGTSPTGPAHA